MPKWVELQRKTGQSGLLIASHKRLRKKDSDRAITPVVEAVCVLAQLSLPGSLQAKQLRHLQAQLSLGQSCHRQKSLVSMCTGSLQSCPTLCDAVDCGLPGFSVMEGGSPGQEYWSVLANAGCHTLLDHYISCCTSHQLPCVPGAARTPAMQTAAPPPYLAFTGGKPKSFRAASGANFSGQPTCRDGNKTTIEIQGQCD